MNPALFFTNALWAAVLLGIFLPVIGRYLILWRAVLLGLVIPQFAMTGIAFLALGNGLGWQWVAYLPNEQTHAIAGALLFGLPGLFLIAAPWKRNHHVSEAWLAVFYLASVSLTNLMLSSSVVGESYLKDLFHGQILFIDMPELVVLGGILGGCFIVLAGFRKRFLLLLTDADYAAVTGIAVGLWTALATLLMGTAIGASVAVAGPLVTFGFLVLPVLTANVFARSLTAIFWLSITIGAGIAMAGFWCSCYFDLPMGDTIVAVGCVLLLLFRGVRFFMA